MSLTTAHYELMLKPGEWHRRGSVQTTMQMILADPGSVYIWPNNHVKYPKALALELLRDDLIIEPHSILQNVQKYAGRHIGGVVFDHACSMTDREYQALEFLKSRIKLT